MCARPRQQQSAAEPGSQNALAYHRPFGRVNGPGWLSETALRRPDSRIAGRPRRLLLRPAAKADWPPRRVRPRALGLIARADCSQPIRDVQGRRSAAGGVSAPKPCGRRACLSPPRCVAPHSRTAAGTCRSSRLAGRAQSRSRCSQRFGAETPSVHRNLTRARQPSSGAMPFSSPRPSVRAETTLPAQLGNLQPSRAISAGVPSSHYILL
jgi:hypothetical protein